MPAESIRDVALPLRTVDPADRDDSDLEVLRDVVGDARVVCLGESAHFVSEFYRIRDRVLRLLVRKLGFSAFVLESGLLEGLAVDDWVRGGPGTLVDIARSGLTYAFGRCDEMQIQLAWMRNWNATGEHPVGFYGMDVPGWCVNPGPGVAVASHGLPHGPGTGTADRCGARRAHPRTRPRCHRHSQRTG
jgi:erythromycin esterase